MVAQHIRQAQKLLAKRHYTAAQQPCWILRQGLRTSLKDVRRRDEDWVDNCYCDYAYHLMLLGDIEPPVLQELEELIPNGYPTVKFMTNITPSRAGRMVHFGDIWEVFKIITRTKGLGVIHAEDNDLVMHMYEKLIREGRVSFHNLAEVHSALSEDLSFRRVIRLAESENTPLYMMHVSAGTGVQAIRESRAKGQAIYGEHCINICSTTLMITNELMVKYIILSFSQVTGRPG